MTRYACVTALFLLVVYPAAAQERGYLAIDEQDGRHAFSFSSEADAVNMCGTTACEVMASFSSCLSVAYSSTTQGQAVWTWLEAATEGDARVGALSECQAAGGAACEVLGVDCIEAPAVEAALGLDQAARRRIQQGLGAAGFDAGAADGLFGPRTRQAIRQWQSSRGAWASGYLTGAQVEVLRGVGGLPQLASVTPPAATPPPVSPEQENLFWQSVMNSTNPAEFEAYLRQFPNGVFSDLAEARLAALRAAAGGSSGASAAASADPRPQPGEVFRDCDVCPEMVVMPDSRLALGRYEVTVGEYLAFASATGGGAGRGCTTFGGDSWRDVYWYQTYLHPVTCVSWDDAQAYVSWLSRMAGATYRLPSQAEWEQAAAGSQPGCAGRGFMMGTCPVGSYGANGVGLSDMVGNLWEWTEDCEEGDCSRRVLRGGSWKDIPGFLRATVRLGNAAGSRLDTLGFRVARTLN